jgi:hypothetical protein
MYRVDGAIRVNRRYIVPNSMRFGRQPNALWTITKLYYDPYHTNNLRHICSGINGAIFAERSILRSMQILSMSLFGRWLFGISNKTYIRTVHVTGSGSKIINYMPTSNLVPRLFLRGRKDPGRSWSRGSQKINCLRGCGKSIILHPSTSALKHFDRKGWQHVRTSKYLLNLISVCS